MKIVIALMSVAVIGLIAIQIFWIINMFSIEEERFEKTVSDALGDVVKKIERKETADLVLENIIVEKEMNVFLKEDSSQSKKIFIINESSKENPRPGDPAGKGKNINLNVMVTSGDSSNPDLIIASRPAGLQNLSNRTVINYSLDSLTMYA